jgi:type III pantothenate kinase
MLFAVDIGNSDVTIGINDKSDWIQIWRMPSGNLTEVYYGLKLQNYFLEAGIKTSDIHGVVISSVVPSLTETFVHVASTLFSKKPVMVDVSVFNKLPVKVLNPYQIGSDLVANAVAGYNLYKRACVIVDFGTALTFTVVGATGEILGVAITPGLKTALKSLSQNTAKLFDVPLEFPASVLGKNTVHAIQAGLLYGYEGIVINILNQIRLEVDAGIASVATGGLCGVFPNMKNMVSDVRPTLTLDGLMLIHSIVSADTTDLKM